MILYKNFRKNLLKGFLFHFISISHTKHCYSLFNYHYYHKKQLFFSIFSCDGAMLTKVKANNSTITTTLPNMRRPKYESTYLNKINELAHTCNSPLPLIYFVHLFFIFLLAVLHLISHMTYKTHQPF